jgi:hypothetical protein
MKEDLVEYQLVAQLYEALLEQCHDLGLVPPGVKRGEVVIYYQTEVGNQANYHQLFVLPNGALFMSEVSDHAQSIFIVIAESSAGGWRYGGLIIRDPA